MATFRDVDEKVNTEGKGLPGDGKGKKPTRQSEGKTLKKDRRPFARWARQKPMSLPRSEVGGERRG